MATPEINIPVNIKYHIPDETARACLSILEIWLNNNNMTLSIKRFIDDSGCGTRLHIVPLTKEDQKADG